MYTRTRVRVYHSYTYHSDKLLIHSFCGSSNMASSVSSECNVSRASAAQPGSNSNYGALNSMPVGLLMLPSSSHTSNLYTPVVWDLISAAQPVAASMELEQFETAMDNFDIRAPVCGETIHALAKASTADDFGLLHRGQLLHMSIYRSRQV